MVHAAALRQLQTVHVIERLPGQVAIAAAFARPRFDVGVPSNEGRLQAGGFKRIAGVLHQHAQPAGDFPPVQRVHAITAQGYAAALRQAQAGQGFQQRCLAHAVGAQHAKQLARANDQIEIVDDLYMADANAQIFSNEGGRTRGGHGQRIRAARYSSSKNSGTPIRAVSTPTGSWRGLSSERAAVSASTRNPPPNREAAGSRTRWSAPTTSRIRCGTIRPTKPMAPASETASAVSREATT